MANPERQPSKITRRELLAVGIGAGFVGVLAAGIAIGRKSTTQPETQQPTQDKKELAQTKAATNVETKVATAPVARTAQNSRSSPTPEVTRIPEIKRGVLWKMPIAQNFLLSEGVKGATEFYSRQSEVRGYGLSGKGVLVRSEDGIIIEFELEAGLPLWKWSKRGAVLASDRQRIFIQEEERPRIYILDAASKSEINKVTLEDMHPDLIKLRYRAPAYLTEKSFIRPLGSTVVGSGHIDGFEVFDRDGQFWWSSDILQFGTRENQHIVDIVGNTLISTGEQSINLWKTSAGEITGEELLANFAVDRNYYSGRTTFAYNKDFIVTAQVGKAALRELATGKRRWEMTTIEGFSPQNVYLSTTSGTILLESARANSQTQLLEYLYLSLNLSGQLFGDRRTEFGPRVIFAGETEKYDLVYESGPGLLHAYSKEGASIWQNDEIVGINYLGQAANTLILANWDVQLSKKYEWGRPKIYGVDPMTGKEAWPPVEIATKDNWALKTVMREGSIWVIGEQIVRINAKTGTSEVLAVIGNGVRNLTDTGDIAFFETEQNSKRFLIALRPY